MIPIGITPAEYRRVHHFVIKENGRASFCARDVSHKSKRFEWSNISGKYKWDSSDYESLCVSCHRKKDIKPDTRYKLSQSHMGQVSARKRAVRRFTKDGTLVEEYESLTRAAQDTKILITSIANALSGRSEMAGGYIWK